MKFTQARMSASVKRASLCSAVMFSTVALSAAPAAAQEEVAKLEEVVVSARFRDENLQDIPASIRAFSGEQLDNLGVATLGDLTRFTPSLNVQERGPNRNELNIRGVTNLFTTQDLLPSARPIGVYLDEVPINTIGGAQVDVRNFDLQRVEVLRGPQGTLYGEGSSAGALRYFTNDPVLGEFEGRFEVEGVSASKGDQDFGVRGAINIPLTDTAAVRFSGGRYVIPGYVDSINEKDSNDFEALNLRGVLLAEPTDRLGVRLMVSYDESEQGSLGLVTDVDNLTANLPTGNDQIDDESLVVSAKIDYEFDKFTVTSLTGYFDRERRRDTFDQIFSFANSLATIPFFGFPDRSFNEDGLNYDQWSQEFRFVSNFDGPLQLTAGVFYREFTYENIVLNSTSATYPLVGLPGDNYNDIFAALGIPRFSPALVNDGEQQSVYAELTYEVTDKLSVIAGARYHNEELVVDSAPNAIIFGLAPFPLPEITEEVDIDVVLPKFAVQYAMNDDLQFFAQYATGARNGNVNSTVTLGILEAFLPGGSEGLAGYEDDSTAAYEIGMKSRFWDGRATFNASLFYTDYEDLQVVLEAPPFGFALLANAGEATNTGFEAEFAAQITDRLSVFAGANYVEAELGEDLVFNPTTGETLPSGTLLPNTPEFGANAGFEYEAPAFDAVNWYINGNWSYTGKYTSDLSLDAIELGEFSVFGAGAGLRGDSWSADLVVTNLTDESEVVAQNLIDPSLIDNGIVIPTGVTFDEIFALAPRMVRLAFRYQF